MPDWRPDQSEVTEDVWASRISAGDLPDQAGHSCNEMLRVAQQWLETWRQTKKRRHLHAALICHRIARERFVSFMATLKRDGSLTRHYEAEVNHAMAEIQRNLEEIRRSLNGLG